jgi:hypothetical protein
MTRTSENRPRTVKLESVLMVKLGRSACTGSVKKSYSLVKLINHLLVGKQAPVRPLHAGGEESVLEYGEISKVNSRRHHSSRF